MAEHVSSGRGTALGLSLIVVLAMLGGETGGTCVPIQPTEPQCVVSGCSGEICASEPVGSDCVWQPEYACLSLSTCGPLGEEACGWEQTPAYLACLAELGNFGCEHDSACPDGFHCACTPDPACPSCGVCVMTCVPDEESPDCARTGCSGQVCASAPVHTDCEWLPWYACYDQNDCGAHGADGTCAWLDPPAFLRCVDTSAATP